MTPDELRASLTNEITQAQFRDLAAALRAHPEEERFALLWPLALNTNLAPVDHWASSLLVELEPACPLTVEHALRDIAKSLLNLSNELVPLYLATQFGKDTVREACGELANKEYREAIPERLKTIPYWLARPAVELARRFCKWRHG
jgi:hypothetical protein